MEAEGKAGNEVEEERGAAEEQVRWRRQEGRRRKRRVKWTRRKARRGEVEAEARTMSFEVKKKHS